MKLLIRFFLLILFTTSTSSLFSQEKITLREAITLALNQNTSLLKSKNNLETSNAALKNAYGNLLPSLSFSSGWSWQRVSNSQGATVINYFGEAQKLGPTLTDSRSYSMSLGGNVTLFDGLANYSTISQRKNDLASATYDFEKLKQDVMLQTVSLFINVTNNEKILKFQQEDLKFNEDMLKKVKEMFDLKMKANADLYSQEYQTSNSRLAYLQAKNNYEKSKITLLTYLSKDPLKEYQFALDSSYVPESVKNLDDVSGLSTIANANRNDYQSLKLKADNADYQMIIARGGYLPSLSGSYGFSTSATTPSDLMSRKVYSLGLSLSFPIFSRWSTDLATQSAQVQSKNAYEDLSAMERQIKSDVKNAVLDLQTASAQLEVSKAALKAATETWQIKRESYDLGTATFIDQQQAYRDYIQAANNAIAAESNYLLKQFGLLSATGLLKAK